MGLINYCIDSMRTTQTTMRVVSIN